jgi:segregation and condensation protein B
MNHPLRPVNQSVFTRRAIGNRALPTAYRARAPVIEAKAAIAGQRDSKLARLEAALWLADEPLTDRKLTAAAGLADVAETRQTIQRLREILDADQSAFQVEQLAGGYQLLTRSEFYPWLVRLNRSMPEAKLSPALLETLAIIAYRQPIMRADLENIRGVHCGDAVRALMERKLIQITGRHDSLGRPVLYGTTKKFLQTFGLKDLSELPPVASER